MKTFHISLGSDCSIAYQLQQHSIKKETLIFDWTKCKNLNKILSLILSEDIVDELLNQKHLKIINNSGKFIVIDEDYEKKEYNDTCFVNIKYNIYFPHDDCNYDTFFVKYKRRIDRFKLIINDKNIHKVFYRISKPSDSKVISTVLNKLNIQNYKIEIIDKEYNADNEKMEDLWKRNNYDWKTLFNI